MKIGILTFHYAHNYGAMLQAYALTTYLNNQGFDAEIIDYRLHYIYRNHERYGIIGYYKWLHEKNNILFAFLKTLKSYFKHRNKPTQWHRFEDFLNNILTKTIRLYNPTDIHDYKYIVCGSDQIWNTTLTGGENNVYWGNGIDKKINMISYAASTGSDKLNIPRVKLHEKLKRFKSISVREMDLCDWLNTNNILAECVIDPVFLLTKHQWKDLVKSYSKEQTLSNYLLIYAFQEDFLIYQIAQNIAKQKNLKIIRLCYNKRKDLNDFSCVQVDTCGPIEFINYFMNASYICTNSFHGVAFSILFNKQFYSVSPKKYSNRVTSILNKFNLADRQINNIESIDLNTCIDYTEKNNIIIDDIKHAQEFIEKSLI